MSVLQFSPSTQEGHTARLSYIVQETCDEVNRRYEERRGGSKAGLTATLSILSCMSLDDVGFIMIHVF